MNTSQNVWARERECERERAAEMNSKISKNKKKKEKLWKYTFAQIEQVSLANVNKATKDKQQNHKRRNEKGEGGGRGIAAKCRVSKTKSTKIWPKQFCWPAGKKLELDIGINIILIGPNNKTIKGHLETLND